MVQVTKFSRFAQRHDEDRGADSILLGDQNCFHVCSGGHPTLHGWCIMCAMHHISAKSRTNVSIEYCCPAQIWNGICFHARNSTLHRYGLQAFSLPMH